jgi:hypothetical protein
MQPDRGDRVWWDNAHHMHLAADPNDVADRQTGVWGNGYSPRKRQKETRRDGAAGVAVSPATAKSAAAVRPRCRTLSPMISSLGRKPRDVSCFSGTTNSSPPPIAPGIRGQLKVSGKRPRSLGPGRTYAEPYLFANCLTTSTAVHSRIDSPKQIEAASFRNCSTSVR